MTKIYTAIALGLIVITCAAAYLLQQQQRLETPNNQVLNIAQEMDSDPKKQQEINTLAHAGHPLAMRLLADQAKTNIASWPQALAWYQKAADAGDDSARFEAAMMHLQGQGASENPQLARRELAQLTTLPRAQYRLGLMLIYGQGGAVDTAKGQQLIMAAAQGQDKMALFLLANWYLSGEGNRPKDEQKALQYFEAAANRQYPPAMQTLALAYETADLGLKMDLARAQTLRSMAEHIAQCKDQHNDVVKLF
ncbi:tetratricopeptide repeat protein [uncultured Deefgea sp.]|uniref:tetratricopeptide repeat protein n=1 Tax=uncultured Deefgea sp. TaxID=1304914 RepID=UPI002599C82D|nr:tetratricopeptide repeat protein [uncultured Deefgea sp.]